MDPGTRIGAYVVERPLGSGSMGEVFRVVHAETGAPYALKLLSPALADDPELAERFHRELLTQARLSAHPHVVGVQDVGRDPRGVPYFVMDLVEGPTWRRAMREGQLIQDGIRLVAQVGDALEAAHAAGLVHRDVKPDNVLIDAQGNARLTDFGVVAGENSELTSEGQLFGTVTYMAPELANSAHGPVGPWTDVFSLGAILYELLTGRTPLEGGNAMLLLTQLVGNPDAIRPPQELRPNVDPRLAEIAMRALAHRPEARYASAGVMAEDVRRALRGEQISPAQVRAAAALEVWQGASAAADAAPMQTVVEDDEPPLGFDAPAEPREGRSWLEPAVYTLALVGVLGVGYATYRTFNAEPVERVERISYAKLDRHLKAGEWQAAISEGARLKAAFPAEEPEIEARMITVYLGRAEGAFRAGNTLAARQELPDDPPADFEPLGWIYALSGEAELACAAFPEDEDPVARLHVAAWAHDAARAEAALGELAPERALAYRWILSEVAPELRPPERDLGEDEALEDWALLARGHEALARGVVALAALDFEALHQDARQRELILEAQLGRTAVFVARGQFELAARALGEAAQQARAPLERARCLSWAATIQPALDPLPGILTSQLGQDPTFEADKFAPGLPRVVRARHARELARALRDLPAPSEAKRQADPQPGEEPKQEEEEEDPFVWPEVDVTLRHPRVRARLALHEEGAAPFVGDEADRCRAGEDGPVGVLLARAADLAQQAYRGADPLSGKEAEDALELVARLCPESPLTWVARAQAHLAQHELSEAEFALLRATRLAPADPEVLLWSATLLRARAMERALARERADLQAGWAQSPPEEDLALFASALSAFEALASREDAVGPRARRSAAEVALELAWRSEGEAATRAYARAASLLAPWLPEGLESLAQRRGELFAPDAELRQAAAEALGAQARELPPESVRALELASFLPGREGQLASQAYLALAGDLPALAQRELTRASQDPDAWEAALARAEQLAPRLPAVGFARAAQAQTYDGAALRELLQAALARPDLFQLALMLPFREEAQRAPRTELLRAFDPGQGDPGFAHLARAFVLRTEPFPEAPVDAPARERAQAFLREVARRGVLETHAALCAGRRDPEAFMLSAMLHAGLAEGATAGAPPDHRVAADVLHFMRCALGADPRSQSLQRIALNWASDLPWLLDALVARGYTRNAGVLPLGPQQGEIAELLTPVRPLMEGRVALNDTAQLRSQIDVLLETGQFPGTATTLSYAYARRDLRGSLALLAGGVGDWAGRSPALAAFVRAQQAFLSSRASGSPLTGAVEDAYGAWHLARAAGADWAPPARRGDATPLRVAKGIAQWDLLSGAFLPYDVELRETWSRLNEPAVFLAFACDHARREGPPDPAQGARPWTAAHGLLWTLSEGPSQARYVPTLAAAGAWTEAAATALRAGSFHRRLPPSATLEQFARQIRDASRTHPDRAQGIEAALLVAREAQRFAPGPAWLEAALLLDRGDEALIPDALRLARASIGADDPLERAWTLARAEVVAGEALSYLSTLEAQAQKPGAQASLRTWLASDPWAERLRASPLGALLEAK